MDSLAESQDVSPRTRRAIMAASAAGRGLGLQVQRPAVLHDAFSVIVYLAPSPVVARVPVVLPPGLDTSALVARQVRELSMAGWLADNGQPVVRPSPLVPRLPVLRDGFSITLWEAVDVDRSALVSVAESGALVARLHEALRQYSADLPFLGPVALTVPPSLRFLEEHPGLLTPEDLDRAKREWDILGPLVASAEAFAAAVPGARIHPIHGDSPAYNLLRTSKGPLHADFEDACLGPPEWDMALAGSDAIAAYNKTAGSIGLPPLDPAVLRVVDAVRRLQLVAAFALVPQLPSLAQSLTAMRDHWRTTPPAGGLLDRIRR